MEHPHIGIALSAGNLQLALVKNGQLLATASAPLPEGFLAEGRATDLRALARLLKATLKTHHWQCRRCTLVLPHPAVLSQSLQIPGNADPETELRAAFRDYLGADAGDYTCDYRVTEIREGHCTLLAGAVSKDLTEQYWQICHQAGLNLTCAISEEAAWHHLIRSRSDLPQKLAILEFGCATALLHIFSGGNFVLTSELEFTAHTFIPEVRRAVNFYNYALPDGETPLTHLYVCEDLPLAGAEESGLLLHPLRELLAAAPGLPSCPLAVGAAMVPPADPTGHRMNFLRHQPGFDLRRVLPALLAAAMALLVFVKIGILDPLEQKALAYDALSRKQTQLEQLNIRLEDFDEVYTQSIRYGTGLMTEAEAALVSREAVLHLVETAIAPKASIENLTINQNILTVRIQGTTLETTGAIVTTLEASPLVDSAAIHSATANENRQASILISVTLAATEGD